MERNLTTISSVRELQRKLYLKVKSQPNFRFYALYDKIYRKDFLDEAWKRVKSNHGSPGIDDRTIEDIEKDGVEEFLKGVQEELSTRKYQPQPSKRVNIPKPDGRLRPLSIPTIKDRVVQMALKLVIEPIFEAGFEDGSYGYRPRRSGQQAAAQIRKGLNYGMTKVIDADLEDCFGSIPHKELLDMIAGKVVDKRVLHLVKLFLKAGVMEEGKRKDDGKGTPQGGVISPLLANIYLDRMDKGWKTLSKYARLIRYADDLVIMTRYNAKENFSKLQKLVTGLKLKLNLKKTRLVDADKESFDFLGFSFKRKLNVNQTKRLGYYWPSRESEKRIRGKVKAITNRARPVKVEQIIKELKPVVAGWVNYYRIANSTRNFKVIRLYVAKKVRKFMRKRRIKAGYGYKEYSDRYLYNTLGLYKDYRIRWMKT